LEDAKTLYLAGLKAFGQGRFAEAEGLYRRALELRPDWSDVLHGLATALSKQGRHEEAVAVIDQVLKLEPNDAFAYTSQSIFLMRMGKIPEAEKAAAQARMINWKEELKKNPNAPPPAPPGGIKVVQ
jgi:Flp pilus assembly protein TadD